MPRRFNGGGRLDGYLVWLLHKRCDSEEVGDEVFEVGSAERDRTGEVAVPLFRPDSDVLQRHGADELLGVAHWVTAAVGRARAGRRVELERRREHRQRAFEYRRVSARASGLN